MIKTPLPKFDLPPVIETVLSAQFSPLPNFSNAHAGWFWKSYLNEVWDHAVAAPRLDDHFEKFSEESMWIPEGGRFMLQTQPAVDRLQIIRSDNLRMIQCQNTRFVYNWRKLEDGDYPSYEKLLPEFKENFDKYQKFVSDSKNPEIKLNQWEVTYVNHIPKGELWDQATDWQKILPGFGVIAPSVEGQTLDNFRGVWSFALDGNKGRIHIDLRHVRVGGGSGPEALLLQLTARGAVNKDVDLYSGFDIGHEAIVRTFADMTSKECHTKWKRGM
ncbi:MAG: TIGR04255 family protein [Gammaproteobacteria bacterium]|nr:TIGR04255 family protein [Gammaproteobacteria bacterium]